jgi:hypothetical protein
MKKLVFLISVLFLQPIPSIGNETHFNETPATLYGKVAKKSYFGKFETVLIDKEINSTELPFGTVVKSKTYFTKEKAREDTSLSNFLGAPINFITIFTKENTYII